MQSLLPYNTFRIQAFSKDLIEITSIEQLTKLIKENNIGHSNYLILGCGSNILFTKNFDGMVLKNSIKGISIEKEDKNSVWIKSMSGENWSNLVDYCVENEWGGIENLSLIPGTVGAAPVQNIGAYGIEIKNRLENLEAIDMINGEKVFFSNEQCQFGYRDSIFKNKFKNRYFITAITLKLDKTPSLNTSYGDIKKTLDEQGINNPTIFDVSNAVKYIRTSKLPDPAIIGNAGSFFKNPVIDKSQFEKLYKTHPEIKYFAESPDKVKIAAAWLIEKAGYKGYNESNVAVHDKQALVIINKGNASGDEVKNLAFKIIEAVKEKFGILLTPEVNIL